MALKLLFVNSSLTDGGSERAMALVADALADRGHEVTMALVREKPSTYGIHADIRLVSIRYRRRHKLLIAIERIREIRRLIRTGMYDFVVCYMWDLNFTTLIASLGLRTRVIVSERSFRGSSARSSFSRALEHLLYGLAHRIIYQTAEAQALCPPRLAGRSVVVPNIINSSFKEVFNGRRSQTVVAAGRLVQQKNFPLLLLAFAKFSVTNPAWRLEIYGKGGLEESLVMLAEDLRVADSVRFMGYVDDIHSRISHAGMFVLSSDYEGISNALCEAMALGLPVVSTDCPVGGSSLLIENRVSGMLVPVGDAQALSEAMQEIASDEKLARSLSSGARDSVARFRPEILASTWEDQVLC